MIGPLQRYGNNLNDIKYAYPGEIQWSQIDTLSNVSQLSHSGWYNIAAFDTNIDSNCSEDRKFTNKSTGDFKCLLISTHFEDNMCRFGTLLIFSPRWIEEFWVMRIWEKTIDGFTQITGKWNAMLNIIGNGV